MASDSRESVLPSNGLPEYTNGSDPGSQHLNNGYTIDDELVTTGDDPIAICGFSMMLPQGASTPQKFWDMLIEKRCASTEFPVDRLNATGFQRKVQSANTVRK